MSPLFYAVGASGSDLSHKLDLYKFNKLCYLDNLNLWPGDFFQRIEMFVISHDILGIRGYRTINKLIIVRIRRK